MTYYGRFQDLMTTSKISHTLTKSEIPCSNNISTTTELKIYNGKVIYYYFQIIFK